MAIETRAWSLARSIGLRDLAWMNWSTREFHPATLAPVPRAEPQGGVGRSAAVVWSGVAAEGQTAWTLCPSCLPAMSVLDLARASAIAANERSSAASRAPLCFG